ncbi:MAG: leucine-rich repeat protein, partial [Clostridia bacterium]|nr:leucine-rich repeat protein [Clostridia bacterium]
MKKMKKLFSFILVIFLIVGTFGNFNVFAINLSDVSSVASATIGESRHNSPLDYEVGEDIEFYFTLKSGTNTVVAPYLHYSAEMDDGRTLSGYVEAVDGEYTVTLEGGLLRPGFVRLTVSACDKNKNSYSKDTIPAVVPYTCSAGAAVSDISSVYGAPDAYDEFGDFDSFWAAAVAQLDETQATLDFIYYCGEKDVNGVLYDCYEIEINCPEDEYYNSVTGKWHEDNHTMAYLTIPKGKTNLGLKVRYHGYDVVLPNSKSGSIDAGNGLFTADKISLSVSPHAIPAPHNVENAVDTSYVSGDAYLHTYYTNYTGYLAKTYGYSNNHGYNTDENSDPNTTYFKYMILRDLQALNFIKLYFGEKAVSGYESWAGLWDGENILVTGPSQGGLQSLAVAGLDSDVNEVDVEVPWCGDVGAVTDDSDRAKSTLTSKIGFREGLRYIDVANHAANISKDCKVTINAGLIDAICPPSTIFSIYNNLNCDATLTMHQNKAHSTSGTVIYTQTLSKAADNSANERVISFTGSVDSSVKEIFGDAWQNVSGEKVVSSGANSIAIYVVDKNTTTDFASLAKNSTAEAIGIVLTGNDLTKINGKLAEIYALHNDVNSKVWVISNSGTFNASDAENAAITLDACLGGGDRPTENAFVALYGKDGQMGTSFALTANENYAIIPSPLYLSGKGILSETENVTFGNGVMSSNGEDGSIKLRVPPCDAEYSVVGIGDVNAYGSIDGVGLWFVKDGCLTVKGSGAVPSYASASATPWSTYNVSEVIVEEGITSIGSYAFYKKAVTIIIPSSVTDIKSNSIRSGSTVIGYDNTYASTYAKSKNLSFLSLGGVGSCGENLSWQFDVESGIFRVTGTGDKFQPLDADGNVVSIDWQGTNASKRQYHTYATKVKQIIIEAPVTTISPYSFSGFTACEVMELPVTYTSVGVVLNGMKALDTVYTTGQEAEKGTANFSNVASFGWYAASAINAKKIIIGDKTTNIGNEVFKNCKSLEEIVFANKLTTISQYAFQNCTSLKSVSIPSSVKTVNADAFKGCTALEELTVENKELEISGFASGMTALKKIIGYSGSPAETYANSNGIEFESLSFVLNDMPAGDDVFYRLVDNGDGTYTMEFYGDGTAIKAMNTSGEYFTSDSYSGYVSNNDYLKSTHYPFKDKVTKIK